MPKAKGELGVADACPSVEVELVPVPPTPNVKPPEGAPKAVVPPVPPKENGWDEAGPPNDDMVGVGPAAAPNDGVAAGAPKENGFCASCFGGSVALLAAPKIENVGAAGFVSADVAGADVEAAANPPKVGTPVVAGAGAGAGAEGATELPKLNAVAAGF